MAITRLNANKRLSNTVVHNGVVYLAGQLANQHSADIKTQTRETLENIDKLLKEVGSDKTRIISATIYLTDIDAHFDPMNEVWEEWVAAGHEPARACVQAAMFKPSLLVEMSIIAAVE
ncbi:RidA family protein [Pseudomonas sp. X4]|uniref:RidA family protein n=1 Tax=Pseudomonas sp. X4 TaxID=3231526 RepID=UPI00345F95CC